MAKSLLEPEFDEPYQSWRTAPGPETTSRLLTAVDPVLDRAISAHVGVPNPNLKSHARRLALQGLGTYDPERAKLGTHLVHQLQGLKRYARKQLQPLRVPELVLLEQRRLGEEEKSLEEELGRAASSQELAARLNVSLKRLAKLRSYHAPVSEGQLSAVGEGGFQPAVHSPGSTRWLDVVYGDLDPQRQQVMEATLGLHGSPRLSGTQIAKRMRISPAYVSQLRKSIQQLLDGEDELSPF